MMNANELRCGNWVWPINYPWSQQSLELLGSGTINSIDNKGVTFTNYEFTTYDSIRPIPLTEDLFNELGIFLGEDTFNLKIDKDEHDEHKYILAIDRFIISRFYYVHQFQNLYFAITGDELSLKK